MPQAATKGLPSGAGRPPCSAGSGTPSRPAPARTPLSPGSSTILVGSGAVNISLPGGHGAAMIGDVGTQGTDTVTGFTQGQDKIFFSGQTTASRDAVIAAQTHPTANTTVLTFPDNTTMT